MQLVADFSCGHIAIHEAMFQFFVVFRLENRPKAAELAYVALTAAAAKRLAQSIDL